MADRQAEERGLEAAKAYAERMGMDVVTDFERGFVALEDDVKVAVLVKAAKKSTVDAMWPRKLRDKMEREGIQRFDTVTINVLSEDRALLRHHRGC